VPKVSVIVPLYNPRPDYLEEALASVAAQDVDVEIVAVDDGSTERTFEPVLHKYGPSVRVLEKENGGVATARNLGLSAARGEFIAFLDQDDRWRPRKLAKQLALFEADPALDVAFHLVDYVDEAGRVSGKSKRAQERMMRKIRSKDLCGALIDGNFIYSATVLARRSCFERTGGFDPNVDPHDDWDMWLRLALAGCRFRALAEPLAEWRIHPGNTSRNTERMLQMRMAVLDKLSRDERLPQRLRPALRKAVARCLISIAHNSYKRGDYADFRKRVSQAARTHWPAAVSAKVARRWVRGALRQRLRKDAGACEPRQRGDPGGRG